MKTLKVLFLAMLITAIASPAKACICDPNLAVEKRCPTISKVGDEMCYTVIIENTGDTDLMIFSVEDSLVPDLIPNCVGMIIKPSDFCIEEYCYVVPEGAPDPLENTVTVEAEALCPCQGELLVREASCSTDLVEPGLAVEKICPEVSKVGDEACYELVLTNPGEVPVLILDAFDTIYGPIGEWIGQIISPGESWPLEYCIIVPPGAPDPLPNEVFVIGEVLELGNTVEATDFCETDLVKPGIDLEKTVNDPNACPGETVIYTICIENTGDWPLENVVVTDPDLGGILPEFPPILFPGEIACADFPYVIPPDAPCPLVNCAEVTANPSDLPNVIDANDCAEICCEPPGDEGCTPGFWKNNADKHSASAWCDAYAPDDSFNDVFGVDVELRGNGRNTISNPTLLQALGANGNGINALARHATAALLNACSGCVNYAMASPVQVIVAVQEAVAVGDEAIQALHEELAYYNEAGCPVNQQAECVGVEESD